MQRRHLFALISACALSLLNMTAMANVKVGQSAPEFTLTDASGKSHSLSEFKGKTVVLEWNNPECPFVRKHYGSGNMQKQQAAATASGVVWLTIASGNTATAKSAADQASAGGKSTAYLLDADGKVGKLFGAKTTPHLFVVDKSGVLRYMGGIDSVSSTDQSDVAKATQYVPQVLSDLAAGKAVSVATSQPYGCSVKY